ncbi:unnamed protein product [Nezara viridula]|uniref:Serpin domain-containing protein n=1 Tax=Nezara viridula TaxID=85310 RepID=A0A9P0MSQ6_NEZVI|nr:unnamed protein product [Nezara viridula]
MVPSITPLIENRDITIPDDQEAEQTSKASLTEPTTAKIETNDEETQPTGEVSKPGSTIPTTTDSITADGNNQQTEEVISVRENETQKTEETPKVTTDVANTQSEETQTTPNVQTSISSQTETRTAGTISEASTLETTVADIGEVDERFGIIETEVPTTEPLTQKTEITSVSTNSPSTSQTVTDNVPETTTTPLSVTMISQVTNEHKAESEATIVTSVPQPTETSASKGTEVVVNEATPDLTSAAQSEGTNTESQFPTEASTTLPQSTLTESVGTTSASTIPPSTNTETETTNEISTQHTTSEANGTPHDNEIARKRRALQRSKEHFQENREGISNWVPRYHDPRWMYHAPLENWFFSYFGFEKVPVITYTAYLPFAYIDDLATSALQVPLDDSRYYMLILLPQKRYALENLLISLQWCPIRAIINQLKLTAVFATVPVFNIVKHVNLVPALAKLGILSVFNPSTADLSAMSSEKGIFVRTIEQVVTVSLRRYMANQRVLDVQPDEVEHQFIANHPFAYFVIDKETDVVLMTGTIVNPIAYNQ